ncbi:MAG: response regulator [Bacteroidota bacterium]
MNQVPLNPFFKKVLVIDDSETDRFVARRLIQKYEFAEEIVVQESARKALEYIRSLESTPEQLPQFIFLDIRMPEIDGFGFLELYKELPESLKVNCVIMMLSTSLDPEDHQRAESNPYVSKFLNKPLDKEKMEELKQEFSAKKHAA